MVKNLPAMQETHVQSLRQEDSLEKAMATHCSILAQRIPWRDDYSPQSRKESGTMEWLTHDMLTHGKECVNTLPSNYFSSQDELSLVYKELNNDWYMKTEAKDR